MSKTVRPAVLIFAIAALAFALGYVALPGGDAGAPAEGHGHGDLALDPGTEAPDFTIERLDGTELSSDALKGKIVVVDFWATWCGPCLTEIPAYNELHEDYGDQGVQMLGVTLQSGTAEQVRDWVSRPVRVGSEEFELDYPVFMGNDEIEYGFGPIYGFPMTFLVDQDWKIRKKWMGAVPDKSEQLRALIERLLEEKGGPGQAVAAGDAAGG